MLHSEFSVFHAQSVFATHALEVASPAQSAPFCKYSHDCAVVPYDAAACTAVGANAIKVAAAAPIATYEFFFTIFFARVYIVYIKSCLFF